LRWSSFKNWIQGSGKRDKGDRIIYGTWSNN
jgi:hypothetical protein